MTKPIHRQCSRLHCINNAGWGLKMVVPRMGSKVFESPPYTVLIGTTVCEGHVRDVRSEDFMNDTLRGMILAAAEKHGTPAPDFARAYMDGVPVDEPEWQKFEAKREQGKTNDA